MKFLEEPGSSTDQGLPPLQACGSLEESELGTRVMWDVSQF